jgi:hypothetical protein
MRWILVRRTVWEWRQVPGLKIGLATLAGVVAGLQTFGLWGLVGRTFADVALGLAETALMIAGFATVAHFIGKGIRRAWTGRRNRPSDLPGGVRFHILANPVGTCDVSLCPSPGIAIADRPGHSSVLFCHEHSAHAHFVLATRGKS